jgi:hypothetical protein
MANDANSVALGLKAILGGPDHEHALLAVEAEFNDGVTLPRPGAIYNGEKADFDAYPAYEVVIAQSRKPSDDTPLFYVHDTDIYITHVGDHEETLTTLLQRMILAVRRMFDREDRPTTLMPFVGNVPVAPGDEDFSPVGRPRNAASVGAAFIKTGVIRLRVGTIG